MFGWSIENLYNGLLKLAKKEAAATQNTVEEIMFRYRSHLAPPEQPDQDPVGHAQACVDFFQIRKDTYRRPKGAVPIAIAPQPVEPTTPLQVAAAPEPIVARSTVKPTKLKRSECIKLAAQTAGRSEREFKSMITKAKSRSLSPETSTIVPLIADLESAVRQMGSSDAADVRAAVRYLNELRVP